MPDDYVVFNELEAQLRADASGVRVKEVIDLLLDGQAKAKRHLDSGLSREEYAACEAFIAGVDAAVSATRHIWGMMHP